MTVSNVWIQQDSIFINQECELKELRLMIFIQSCRKRLILHGFISDLKYVFSIEHDYDN